MIPPVLWQRKQFAWETKDRGVPCKQGETAASDGCIPAGESGLGQFSTNDQDAARERVSGVLDHLKRRLESLPAEKRGATEQLLNNLESAIKKRGEGLTEAEQAAVALYKINPSIASLGSHEPEIQQGEQRKGEQQVGPRSEEQKAWEQSLPAAQREAIKSWTKGNQLEIRTAMAGKLIPTISGRGVAPPKWAVNRARQLRRVLDSAPPVTGTVYRGMSSRKPNVLDKFLEKSAVVMLEGPASASKDIETATTFLNDEAEYKGTNVMLSVACKTTGADISALAADDYKNQREVIIKPNARYRIRSVTKKELPNYGFDFNRNFTDPDVPASEAITRLGLKPRSMLTAHYVELEEIP